MNGEHAVPAAACENCGQPADGQLRGGATRFRKNRVRRTTGVLVLCEVCHECESRRSEHTGSVVNSDSPRRLIVAGPGTGKTYAFGQVIRALPDGSRALVFTLTNNLARDLQDSLASIPNKEVTANTFHGYCKHLLYARADAVGLTADLIYFPELPKLIEDDAELLHVEYTRDAFQEAFANLEDDPARQFFLDRGAFYDAASHNDAVSRIHGHFEDHPDAVPTFDVVVGDEFQDFNALEASFIELLTAENRILLAGDDDQALYGFRHASTEFIRNLYQEDDRYENLALPYCSRCPPAIVEAANTVVDAAVELGLLEARIPREYSCYWPDKYADDQKHPRIDVIECSSRATAVKCVGARVLEVTSAEGIVAGEEGIAFMIIGPEGRPDLLRAIEKQLLATLDQETFEVVSKEDVPTAIDLLEAYRILRQDENSNLGWRIALAVDPIDEKADVIRSTVETRESLRELLPGEYVNRHLAAAHDEDPAHPSDDENPDEVEEGPPKIKVLVTNFLGSKGLAASHVVIVGLNNGTFPSVPSGITDDEVCKFIVGLTRTKSSCAAVTHKDYVQGRGMVRRPSEFLQWLPSDRVNVRCLRIANGELVEVE